MILRDIDKVGNNELVEAVGIVESRMNNYESLISQLSRKQTNYNNQRLMDYYVQELDKYIGYNDQLRIKINRK